MCVPFSCWCHFCVTFFLAEQLQLPSRAASCTDRMWSWRRWRRERQIRKQLDETLKLKKRSPFTKSNTTNSTTTSSGTTGSGGDGDGAPAAHSSSVALLVQVGQQLDRRAPITLSIVGTRVS